MNLIEQPASNPFFQVIGESHAGVHRLKREPKTEMWYFANCLPGAAIYAGLKKGITRDQFETLLYSGRIEQALPVVPVETGDSIFIPSGRLHAIGEGNVLVEVQQNSDTTYRVYDWNRTGMDGLPRTRHIEESLAPMDFADFEPRTDHINEGMLAECPYFKVEKLTLTSPLLACPDGKITVFGVLDGSVLCLDRTYKPGEFFLAPACLDKT